MTGLAPLEMAVLAEAMKKSGLCWLRVGDRRPRAVWHLWHEDAAYVLHGGDEQPAPGLEAGASVAVSVRSKDSGGRLLTWPAAVAGVAPGSPEWPAVVPLLAAKRLNAPDGPDAPERWARTCSVSRLTPAGPFIETWADPQTGSGAAEATETPATSPVPLPSWLGRRRPRR